MPVARYAKHPKLTPTPRREIDASLHLKIDAFLKSTRQCTQRITPLESCLQDEMRILERLYYKGVNQHRAALFWRRVQEVRKLGRRLHEVQIPGLLDDLRYSFYTYIGEGVDRNPKILKRAWSLVPDATFLNFMFERASGTLELILTAKERLVKAYHSLSLMMQTGAFLQLIVMLTAIVSRIKAITEELESIAQSLLRELEALLEALGFRKAKARAMEKTSQHEEIKKELRALEREEVDADENLGEDLGSTVARKPIISPADAKSRIEPTASFWQQTGEATPIEHEQLSPQETPRIIVKTSTIISDVGLKSDTLEQAGHRTRPVDASKIKNKKRKRRDEIDEIFASL